jgi:hypothetical protein
MKTTNLILVLLAMGSLMACKNQIHVVTLYVDTTNITQATVDLHANFNQPQGISNEDFTTHVRKGDLIIWKGKSISNPDDIVKITAIDHDKGKEIIQPKPFKYIKIKGGLVPIQGSDELVRGKVALGPGRKEAYINEKYILEFTVSNKEGTFTIDPEVQGHKKR